MVVAACGRGAPPAEPVPTPATTAEAPDTTPAWLTEEPIEPVSELSSFDAAIAAGTRTKTGRPGPRYWQQEVSYRIDAELDPRTARLQGLETITYRNNSPDALPVLVLHLYQNLFREGSPRNRNVPNTGGMTIERISVDGLEAIEMADVPPSGAPSYRVDGTLMHLRLPRPLPPGGSVDIEVAWSFTVPPQGAPRTGHIDHRIYNVAQWYPQVAVYDDVEGWHTGQYLGNGEFYLEYADFDVSITVPEGWLVAGTGELQNADEVLTEEVGARLRQALETDDIVQVVGPEDRGAGNATQRVPGGQLTWRFVARDVRDFAFATSNEYVWDATRAEVDDGAGGRRVVAVHAFYHPRAQTWRRAAEYTRFGLEFFSERYGRYIYPQITSVQGPIGGMEYPMVVFVRDFGNARTLASVILHEVAHQWWPMMAGNKEPAYAWQDEGLATYVENQAMESLFEGEPAWQDDLENYLMVAGSGAEQPIMRHADEYREYSLFAIASYSKTAVLMRALAGVIGEETLRRALEMYTERWLLRHPYPQDFFNTVEDVAGRDLDWFWLPWWLGVEYLDQAIVDVAIESTADGGEQAVVTIERQGGVAMPVELVVTTTEGATRMVVIPVDVWLSGARRTTATVTVPGRVAVVSIDPDQTFPDVDRSNNVWRRGN